MMSSKNNGFTASDIERYHSGRMSPQERHALEKAALDDPFLADALEGYAFSSTPSVDLSKIQSRLDEKLHRKKVVPIFQKYKWLSAAAILIIIATGGWFAFNISSNSKETSVALQRNESTKEERQSIQNPTDSVNNKTFKTTASNTDKQTEKPKAANVTRDAESLPALSEQNEDRTVNRINSIKPIERNVTLREKRRMLPAPLNESNNVGNLANIQRAEFNQNQIDTITLNSGYLSEVTVQNPSFKKSNADASAPIRVRGTVPADSVSNLNIVLKPLPMDSAQTVVIGYATQNKAKDRYPKVTIDTLEPAEGYVNFDDYVATNLKVPEELRTKTVSGEVQLSFDVDKNGQPTNIAVVKSLCQKCDEEAIRLLKEGPKWKKKKNQKGKITIKF